MQRSAMVTGTEYINYSYSSLALATRPLFLLYSYSYSDGKFLKSGDSSIHYVHHCSSDETFVILTNLQDFDFSLTPINYIPRFCRSLNKNGIIIGCAPDPHFRVIFRTKIKSGLEKRGLLIIFLNNSWSSSQSATYNYRAIWCIS